MTFLKRSLGGKKLSIIFFGGVPFSGGVLILWGMGWGFFERHHFYLLVLYGIIYLLTFLLARLFLILRLCWLG